MRLAVTLLGALALLGAAPAGAHAPTTAIGRAVEALDSLSVSYEAGSPVTDVEAGSFTQLVGSNPKVAFMPPSALSEMVAGTPDAIAEEVADEADLDGTLVVLAGSRLGAWSDEISDARLSRLVADARALPPSVSPAVRVESLVRAIQSEPVDSDPPWVWIGVALLVAAVGAVVALDRAVRRRP